MEVWSLICRHKVLLLTLKPPEMAEPRVLILNSSSTRVIIRGSSLDAIVNRNDTSNEQKGFSKFWPYVFPFRGSPGSSVSILVAVLWFDILSAVPHLTPFEVGFVSLVKMILFELNFIYPAVIQLGLYLLLFYFLIFSIDCISSNFNRVMILLIVNCFGQCFF